MRLWKKILAAAVPMTLALSFSAFAGQWQQSMNGWWYENDDGSYLKDGWYWVDGDEDGTAECYYFTLDGYAKVAYQGETASIDGYLVNKDGAWVVDGVVQTKKVDIPRSESEQAALDVYRAAQKKNNSLDSMDADVNYTVSMEAEGMSMDIGLNVNMKMKGITTNNLSYVMDGSMTMLGSELPLNAFYVDGYQYMDMMGTKVKQAIPQLEALEAATSNLENGEIDEDMMGNLAMSKEDGNTVITYTVRESKINDLLEATMGNTGMTTDVFNAKYVIKSCDGKVTINPDGYYTSQTVNMDMDMVMTDNKTGEESKISYVLDMEMNVNNPGQPVDFEIPSTEGYTEAETV